ncbi:ThiF family adenylyltransferase [Planctomycetota bacterium]
MNLSNISNKELKTLCKQAQQHINEINRATGTGIPPKYSIIEHGGEFDCGVVIRIEVQVELPSRPIENNINSQEPILLYFPLGAEFSLEVYSGRKDFPHLPHVMRRGKKGLAELCLFRTSLADWLAGRTFEAIVYRIRKWLEDASAGLLIKPDDPYEPLWVPMVGNIVEMDIDAIREENIPWIASAKEYKADGRHYFRVFERGGNIPVRVFYNPDEQIERWAVYPISISDIEEMFNSAGFNLTSDFRSVNEQSGLSQFILILGVKRPKEILGRENSDEWISFLFTRKKTRKGALIGARKKDRKNLTNEDIWMFKCLPVRSILTKKLAIDTSGWKSDVNNDQLIGIIGAGALGSKVIMNLARSGMANILIIDKDIVRSQKLAPPGLLPPVLLGEIYSW